MDRDARRMRGPPPLPLHQPPRRPGRFRGRRLHHPDGRARSAGGLRPQQVDDRSDCCAFPRVPLFPWDMIRCTVEKRSVLLTVQWMRWRFARMARRKTDHLRAFSTSKKRELDRFEQALMLHSLFRCSMHDLRLTVVRDRFLLATRCLTTAKRGLTNHPASYRDLKNERTWFCGRICRRCEILTP
jgi:hypothetical protein